MLIPQTRVRWLRPETDYAYPFIAQAMADVIAEGGNGALGSHGEHHGLDAHWEVWMEASALGNLGALETASLGARGSSVPIRTSGRWRSGSSPI